MKIHSLVKRIFNSETQRPSAAKEWQIPQERVLPIPDPSPCLFTPLEVQATSYFAASDKIFSFSIMVGAKRAVGEASGRIEERRVAVSGLVFMGSSFANRCSYLGIVL